MARKHYTQMSTAEFEQVMAYVKGLSLRASKLHYHDRSKERSFTDTQAKMAVIDGTLIEVHNEKEPDIRALMRDDKGTCVVVSLVSGDIITVYYNDPEDKHYTLNKGQYRWNVDLLDVLRGIRGCGGAGL
jgi:hypothetical protein